ncbi:MAG: glutamate--tRNA ligase, partial [Proteobacteria bacterium]|nr:glutamate--tRNA ligase [Pseudomonadota bacterium]
KEELIEAFSLEGINRANSVFNVNKKDPKFFTDPKALSINSHYIRNISIEELEPYVKAELERAGIWNPEFESTKRDWFLATIDLIRSRYHVTTEFATLGRAYFSDEYQIEEKALKKNILKHDGLKNWFSILADRLEAIESFSIEETENVIRDMAEEFGVKAGVLINGIRAAVTGQTVGPGLFDILIVIGQKRVVERLRKAVSLFN